MSANNPNEAAYELTAWVVLATDGLVAPARERIQQEIKSHIADSIAAHIAEGCPREQAEAIVLTELGDIRTAASGFRKRYLTEAEARWLDQRCGQGFSVRRVSKRTSFWILAGTAMLALCAMLGGLFWWVTQNHSPEPIRLYVGLAWQSFLMLVFLSCLLRVAWLDWHLEAGPERLRRILLLNMIQLVWFQVCNFVSVFAIALSTILSNTTFSILLVAGPVSGLLALLFSRHFRIWRKLRYEENSQRGLAA